jgi:hypothetical protein
VAICRGDVYVMIDQDPNAPDARKTKLFTQHPNAPQPSIWLNDELPTLKYLHQAGKTVNRLFATNPVGSLLGELTFEAFGKKRSQLVQSTRHAEMGINLTQLVEESLEYEKEYKSLPNHVRQSTESKQEKRWDSCGAACNA